MADDAETSAAGGRLLPPPHAHPYVHALRLHQGARGFVALCAKPGTDGRSMSTRCYEGPELFTHLPPPGALGEHFISVNTFKSPRRTVANLLGLRACFTDLDYYNLPVWAGATEDAVWDEVLMALAAAAMPRPTMVVASGRGLQLYWTFPKGLPPGVLGRWIAVQRHIYDVLRPFGADPNCRDAPRILRLAGTHNAKAGKVATFLHLDFDRDVDFEDLAKAVLPLSQWQLQDLRRQRAERNADAGTVDLGRSSRARDAHRAYIDTMIADIDRLAAYRWGGRIPEGHRNQWLFVRGSFLVRRLGMVELEGALLAFGLATCDLGIEEMRRIAGSIVAKIRADGRGYRYGSAGAAEALGVTVEEVRAAGLVRLHPADPQLQAERSADRRKKDRERKAEQRRAAGIPSRKPRGAPWKALGISKSAWYVKYYNK